MSGLAKSTAATTKNLRSLLLVGSLAFLFLGSQPALANPDPNFCKNLLAGKIGQFREMPEAFEIKREVDTVDLEIWKLTEYYNGHPAASVEILDDTGASYSATFIQGDAKGIVLRRFYDPIEDFLKFRQRYRTAWDGGPLPEPYMVRVRLTHSSDMADPEIFRKAEFDFAAELRDFLRSKNLRKAWVEFQIVTVKGRTMIKNTFALKP